MLVSDTTGNKLLVYDAASRELVKTIVTADGPSGIQLDPDGSRAFVACSGAKKVQIVDLGRLEIAGSIDTGVPDGLAYAR